jgi:hypothetical protein
MSRRPNYFVVNVLIPIVFLNALNLLVFLISADSGERLSYAITVLLAITVFLTSVSETLPKTSQPMSILSYYLLSNISISILICFFSILIVRLHSINMGSAPPPAWLCTLLNLASMTKTLSDEQDATEATSTPSGGRDNTSTAKHGDSETETPGKTDPQPSDQNVSTWTDVARVLNRISGTFCVVCQLVATTMYFVMVTNGSNSDTL